jgi:hypothetical protein
VATFDDDVAELDLALVRAAGLVERDPQAAAACALVGVAQALRVMTAELRGIRNELMAMRLSS